MSSLQIVFYNENWTFNNDLKKKKTICCSVRIYIIPTIFIFFYFWGNVCIELEIDHLVIKVIYIGSQLEIRKK